MAFHEIRLDMKYSYGSTAGPTYKTTVLELPSGDEQRIGYWSKGRKSWKISKELLSRQDLKDLEAFFRARKGKLYGFRLRDWNWYLVTDEALPLTDNTHAQLQFVYPDSVNAETQIVTKPVLSANVNNTITDDLYSPDITLTRSTTGINGTYSAFASGGNWSIDRNTGIITFTGSQAGNYFKWSGSYDWPVRFDVDIAEFHREAMDIHDWSSINLVELKQ